MEWPAAKLSACPQPFSNSRGNVLRILAREPWEGSGISPKVLPPSTFLCAYGFPVLFLKKKIQLRYPCFNSRVSWLGRERSVICSQFNVHRASLVSHMVKNLSAMQETWVWSLGWEDTLDKKMATHSSVLPGGSQGQRSLAGYGPWGGEELDTTEWLTPSAFTEHHLERTG